MFKGHNLVFYFANLLSLLILIKFSKSGEDVNVLLILITLTFYADALFIQIKNKKEGNVNE